MTSINKTHPQAALVTGGAKRIGKAVCLKLSSLGFAVALHYNHSKLEAQKVVDEIRNEGGVCELLACDLNRPHETETLIKKAKKIFPGLNLLVYSASIFEPSELKTATLDSLDRHFNINFKAPFILTQHFIHLCGQGHIINILDTNITKNWSKHFTYLLSKKTLYELTKLSALALAPAVRVNAIAPGFVLNPISKSGKSSRTTKDIPLKRRGNVEQITECIEFLIKNDYLTGQVIFNDGGEHLL